MRHALRQPMRRPWLASQPVGILTLVPGTCNCFDLCQFSESKRRGC